jgi:hypothetical protein
MTSASEQSSPSVPSGAPGSQRSLEFAQALDRYIASYAVENRGRHDRSAQVPLPGWKPTRRQSMVRQLGGFIAGALTGLGNAMSAGGRSAAGIM